MAASALGALLALAAPMAQAVTASIAIGFDTDNNPATGCTLIVGSRSMPGVEVALFTVVTTTVNTGTVGAITRRTCTAGVFAAPTTVSAGGWPVGMNAGLNSSDLIETFIPLADLAGAASAKVGAVTASDSLIANGLLVLQDPAAPSVPVPALSPLTLLILLVSVGGTGWLMRRYARQGGRVLLVLCMVGIALTTASALAIVFDGAGADWSGIPPLGTDPAGDAPAGDDLVALYAVKDGANIALRVDMMLARDAANQPPVANAGVNQTITLPATAMLSGSATDDGLPNPPAALTYGWANFSGPGTVTFGNAAGPATTASFSVSGTYVLRLTASDSALAGTADVTIIVNPVVTTPINQPPVVNAGTNQSLTLPAAATLAGSAADDGLPTPAHLSTGWSLVSGPGSGVVFGNSTAPATTATFQAPGTYTLRLTASDGALSSTSDVQVTVNDSAPLLLSVADRTIALGTRYQQVLAAVDANVADTFTYSLLAAPAGAVLNPSPLVDWLPTAAQLGTNTFTAKVTDAVGHTATTTFHVTVTHTNHPPQLAPQINVVLPVGTAFSRALQATDPDAGDTLAFALMSGPPGMTLTGASLHWPTAGRAPGDYSVSVKVTDNGGLSDTKTFTVTLTAAAPAPQAKDDSYDVHLGQTLTIPAAGVLANDDGLGLALTAVKVTDPAKGTLNALNADGGFTYTAPAQVPAPKTLSPVVVWRKPIAETTTYTFAADLLHDGRIEWISNNFGNLDGWNAADGSHVLQFNKAITTNANVSGCAFTEDQYAIGDVTGSGDMYLFMATNCDDTGVRGFSDRYTAINLTQRLPNGDVAAQWLSERFTRPHPGAYATGTSTQLPNPPVTPTFTFSARDTYPTLARLQPGGATKLLTRFLADRTYGSYFAAPNTNAYSYAACRSLTGLAQDEGIPCKATYILDAATGAIDAVLTAPNTSNDFRGPQGTATFENIPIVADLDGDGQVEIISGGDVWKLVAGTWTLAWQLQIDSSVAGVRKSFEPLSVAVADLDGDGKAEVLFHVIGDSLKAADAGGIYIYNHDGTLRRKIRLDTFNTGLLSVADVDGDGVPEIMVTGNNVLYVYRQDGSLLWAKVMKDVIDDVEPAINPTQYWVTTDAPILVYDLDLDGVPEIILQGARRLFILNGRTGAELWSIDIESDGYGRKAGPKLIDADGDGHVDILVHAQERWNCNYGPGTGPVNCTGNAMLISGANHDWAPGPKIQNQLNFRPGAVDASGSILYEPSVRRDFRQQIQQGTVVDARADSTDSFTYKAHSAGGDSAPAQVALRIMPLNNPPVITSTPPTAQLAVSPYPSRVYTITAYDPDPGDTVHFELVSTTHELQRSFNAVTVDPATGAVDVFSGPCSCNLGLTLINVAAIDSHGARTEQSFLLDINNRLVVVPDVRGTLLPAARMTLETASLVPRVVSETFGAQPAGTVIAQDPLPGAPDIPRSTTVGLTVSKGPAPVTMPFLVGKTLLEANARLAPFGVTVNVTPVFSTTIPAQQVLAQTPSAGTIFLATPANPAALEVSAGPPLAGTVAQIIVEPGTTTRLVGDTLQYKATAVLTDGTSADVTLAATWLSTVPSAATVNAIGTVRGAGNGSTIVRAKVGTVAGESALSVLTKLPGDVTPPTATITSPADEDIITGPVSVAGTASDANFLRYELAFAAAGDENFTLIADSSTPMTGGTLGTFDPTALLNDLYTLRLRVLDRGENESIVTRTIQVAGRQKPGTYRLEYQDLILPAAGIPVTVTRTYDSRDKTTGDFGVGWRLGLKTLRVRTNRMPGTGWVRTQSGATVSLMPTSAHKVSLTLPGGQVEEFDLRLSPTSGLGGLDFTNVTGYAPRPGTMGKLEMLDNPNLLILAGGAEDELVDDTTLDTFDPVHYRYTAASGTIVEINNKIGVTRTTDRNGNTVTFGPDGIIHSSGRSVVFKRDMNGRITEVTDPMGHTQSYVYDGNGDLVSHITATGDASYYKYDRKHRLIDNVDPAGHHAAQNDYDDAGHLVATTDANGHTITFNNDLSARREVVTDRLGNPVIYDYDYRGNVLVRTNAIGQATTYTYDSRDNPLTETDPLGRVATKTYDGSNNVLTSIDFDGNLTTWTYNVYGQVLTQIDPEGFVTTNVYDVAGDVVKTTDPEGGVTAHTYDGAGNRLSTTDPLGRVSTFGNDVFGNQTSRTNPLGQTTTTIYDANGNVSGETDPAGHTTSYTYDSRGRRTSTTDKLGNTSLVAYTNVGLGVKIARVTDATGNVTTIDYDSVVNPLKKTFPDGSSESSTYDLENERVSSTDPDGRTTLFEQDSVGRTIRTTLPGGATVRVAYDAAGRASTRTDERGNTTTSAYTANGQSVTDPLAHVTAQRFDSRHRMLTQTDPLGQVTSYLYDSAGRLRRTTYPDGTFSTTSYDAARQKTAETDQAGRVTQYAYDAAGRLIRITNALGGVTSYNYDVVGNPIAITDANGHVTQRDYDAMGRAVRRRLPSGKQESFIFDANGDLISHTDFNGATITTVYDAMRRMTRKQLPGGATITYAYSPAGLRVQAGGDTYSYDPAGRLSEEHKAGGATLAYSYDAAGNRTSLTTPQGVTTYTYNAVNRLSAVNDATGVTTHTYDQVNRPASIAFANGVTTTYGYDALNRLVQTSNTGPGGLISSYAYSFGPAGNRIHATESGSATTGRTVAYEYDALYRLTQEQITEPGAGITTIGYVFDAVGNRTQMVRGGMTTSYTYDGSDRLISETAGGNTVTSTFDDNGNLVARNDGASPETHVFDGENRLVNVSGPSGNFTFAYDDDGIRTGRIANGTSTDFLVDKNRELPQVVVETTGPAVVSYVYGERILSRQQPGAAHYYLADGQSSTRQLTNGAGTVSDSYTYDAFGVPLAGAGTTPNVYRYTGEQLESALGLYYLRARYAEPSRGRFISPDPFEGRLNDPMSMHRFVYVNGNPASLRDPKGLWGLGFSADCGLAGGIPGLGGFGAVSGESLFYLSKEKDYVGYNYGAVNATEQNSYKEYEVGGSLGCALGLNWTNAKKAKDLTGKSETWTYDFLFFSYTVSKSGNIWSRSLTIGLQLGLGYTHNTVGTTLAVP